MEIRELDQQTKVYRLAQFHKLKNNDDYFPTIKIYGSEEGQTNCLSISKEEFFKIKKLLTE